MAHSLCPLFTSSNSLIQVKGFLRSHLTKLNISVMLKVENVFNAILFIHSRITVIWEQIRNPGEITFFDSLIVSAHLGSLILHLPCLFLVFWSLYWLIIELSFMIYNIWYFWPVKIFLCCSVFICFLLYSVWQIFYSLQICMSILRRFEARSLAIQT